VISLTPVIAALKANGTPFKYVGGAVDLVTAGDHLKQFPSAYVMTMADSASQNYAATYMAVTQDLVEHFGVMYAVRNVKPGAGADAQADMRNAINWARAAILGLQVDASHDVAAFEGGELVSFADEIMIYLDRWVADSQLRKT
jgi:hypothetical protein